MRILIHGLNFAPELVGVGKYTGEMAEWLAARGHEVRVITAPPFNPGSKVEAGYSSWRYSREEGPNGRLGVFRCPLWVPQKASPARRVLHLLSFALSSSVVVLRHISWRPEVVLVIEPTLFCAPIAWTTARLSGGKAWLHIQDFEVDAAFGLGLLKSSPLRSLVSRMERTCVAGFDRVSTISRKMLQSLPQKGVERSRCLLFENWVDTNLIYPQPRPSPLRGPLGIPADSVVALYSGTMGHKQGLEVLCDAVRMLASRRKLEFVFCGDGPGKTLLASALGQSDNVHLLPLQPLERLSDLLNLADIHLLPQRADAADLVMPSKLTGMLASGRPVVTTAREGTQLAAVVHDRGLVVPPAEPAMLAAAIDRLAGDPELRHELGRNARAFAVSKLAKEVILLQFEQDLLDLVSAESIAYRYDQSTC